MTTAAEIEHLKEHGLYSTAHEHDAGVRRQPVPIRQRLADGGLARPVEDHAQGAVLAVLEDEHDRAEEVRVVQRGRGDEQTSSGRIAHPPIMPAAARLALTADS